MAADRIAELERGEGGEEEGRAGSSQKALRWGSRGEDSSGGALGFGSVALAKGALRPGGGTASLGRWPRRRPPF